MGRTVMILTNSDSGLYDFRKELLLGLVKAGFEVVVSVPGGNYRGRIEELGCEYVATDFSRRGMNPLKDASLFLRYICLLKKYKPNVVLTYTVKPNLYGGLACRLLGLPYLVNITGLGLALEEPGRVQRMLVFLYRRSLKKAGCVFFQNEYNRDFMVDRKCISGRTRVIQGSGVNLEEHPFAVYPDEGEGIRVLSPIRLIKAKGVEEYVKAVPKVYQTFPHAVFAIAGAYEEDTREAYEPLIKDLQEKGIVRYYGYREDLPAIMAESHIILNPSLSEGMSNVLLEAAATGRPVVATDIQGCRETFVEGITGIGCQARNADSLEEALKKMLSLSQEERQEMGRRGRKHVEDGFDREKVVNAYMEEINGLIESKGSKKRREDSR